VTEPHAAARLVIAIAGVLAVAALAFLMKFDIGPNAGIPAGGIVEQPFGNSR
jgi:hypothetical protein